MKVKAKVSVDLPKKKIHMKIKKGALHAALGVKQGEKIPAKKLVVKASDSALMKKRKNLAKTFASFKH